MPDDETIPISWIRQKYIQSGKYRGTIVEAGVKVLLKDWEAHQTYLYKRKRGGKGDSGNTVNG